MTVDSGGLAVLLTAIAALLGGVLGVLQYRRGKRSTRLSDFKTQISLWTNEIDQLRSLLESKQDQVKDYVTQVATLTEANHKLTELVTSAARVDSLTEAIQQFMAQSTQYHQELLRQIENTGGGQHDL
jgi:predicted component of type VI protein secretion system